MHKNFIKLYLFLLLLSSCNLGFDNGHYYLLRKHRIEKGIHSYTAWNEKKHTKRVVPDSMSKVPYINYCCDFVSLRDSFVMTIIDYCAGNASGVRPTCSNCTGVCNGDTLRVLTFGEDDESFHPGERIMVIPSKYQYDSVANSRIQISECLISWGVEIKTRRYLFGEIFYDDSNKHSNPHRSEIALRKYKTIYGDIKHIKKP